MSEKARGAVFNALGDVDGLTFLDAYSGSGALSIEAISRGAHSGVAIDSDITAWKTIITNLDDLEIGNKVRATRVSVTNWSMQHKDIQFDIVFADPPYDGIKIDAVKHVSSHVKKGGVFVLSWPGAAAVPLFEDLKQVAHKPLGDIQLVFYRR